MIRWVGVQQHFQLNLQLSGTLPSKTRPASLSDNSQRSINSPHSTANHLYSVHCLKHIIIISTNLKFFLCFSVFPLCSLLVAEDDVAWSCCCPLTSVSTSLLFEIHRGCEADAAGLMLRPMFWARPQMPDTCRTNIFKYIF